MWRQLCQKRNLANSFATRDKYSIYTLHEHRSSCGAWKGFAKRFPMLIHRPFWRDPKSHRGRRSKSVTTTWRQSIMHQQKIFLIVLSRAWVRPSHENARINHHRSFSAFTLATDKWLLIDFTRRERICYHGESEIFKVDWWYVGHYNSFKPQLDTFIHAVASTQLQSTTNQQRKLNFTAHHILIASNYYD